jgi:hypothetical protein
MLVFGHGHDLNLERRADGFKELFEEKVQALDVLLSQRGMFTLGQPFSLDFTKVLRETLVVVGCEVLLDGLEKPSAKSCWPKLQMMTTEQLKMISQLLVESTISSLKDEQGSIVHVKLHDYLGSDQLLKSEKIRAGVHLMLLSEMARELLAIKRLCTQHQPLILDALDCFSEKFQGHELNSEKCLSSLLQQYKVTKELKGMFKGKLSQVWEVGSWLRRIQKSSRQILMTLNRISSKILKRSKDSFDAFWVAIKVWTESEALREEDKIFAQLWVNLSFAKANSDIKQMIMIRMKEVECLLGIIKSKSSDKLKGLSSYLLDTLHRHEKLYRKSAGLDLLLSREMRVSFNMLSLEIAQLRPKLSRVHHLELLEIQPQPLKIKGQLSYFQGQIPEVMFRSNGREVKSMSKTLGFCYRRIPKVLSKESTMLRDSAQVMLTDIVTNATALVLDHHRARLTHG